MAVEVTEAQKVVRVPGSPPFVAGVLGWRDRVIGVVDLAVRLGLPTDADDNKSRVVVIAPSGAAEPVGLLVPRGFRTMNLPVPNFRSARRFPGDPSAITAVVETQGMTVALPDLIALCSSGPA
ncbi:MAG: Chemotaxis protein CheW [Gemmataceae bacterium]|nr:Chemotaxis protein CheW [Gemmataceae bacterium]